MPSGRERRLNRLRNVGGWNLCGLPPRQPPSQGPRGPCKGLMQAAGGCSCCALRPGWLMFPSPAGPLWQMRTIDARVRGHSRGLCAFFPKAPAGGCWEGQGPARWVPGREKQGKAAGWLRLDERLGPRWPSCWVGDPTQALGFG